jgi:transposase
MNNINYIGIDISKNFFDVAYHAGEGLRPEPNDKQHQVRFDNTKHGIADFMNTLKPSIFFVVLESTGGYESELLLALCKQNIPVHRADPLTSSNYIRSINKRAKTDRLDAEALVRYGYERHDILPLFKPVSEEYSRLSMLVSRRNDLIQMKQGEENRLKHPRYSGMLSSLKRIIKALDKEITGIEKEMLEIVSSDSEMAKKMEIMCRMKGVGEKTALNILALLPEIGNMNRRQVASLAGCAPHPRESGGNKGYRKTVGGRQALKKSLFLAAMSARTYNVTLREFYERLIKNGKKPMVALTAVMRKIITIINAQIRDELLLSNHGR